MVHPRHILVLLLAACLAGCGYAMFDPDPTAGVASPGTKVSWADGAGQTSATETADPKATGATSAPADKTNTAELSSLFARASQDKLSDPATSVANPAAKPVVVADAGDTAIPVVPPPQAAERTTAPRGRVYLFRGVAGLIYSRGIDKLAARIRHTGIAASVGTYLLWRSVADDAIRDYRRDPQPITLIGHSMGGDCVLGFAEMLNEAHIPVSLLVTYDPTRIADDVPPNVERYINIFQSSSIMGGGNVVPGSRFHGDYASYNLKDHTEIVHINIEKADAIQEQLVTKIAQLGGTPDDAAGEAVPIRLEVPADSAIELWDSGVPIAAHAGDTLKSLAATYNVPLWALAQLNSVKKSEPLAEGQRVVIPRHLVPTPASSTVTSYAPVER